MATENAKAHEQLVARIQATLATFLPMGLVAGTASPRERHNTPERYLAIKVAKKVWGIFPGYEEEKVFAAYALKPAADGVHCYLFMDRTGLLEEVKRVICAFHADTKVHVRLDFMPRGRAEISYMYPPKPLSLPPQIALPSISDIEMEERRRHAAKKFSR